MPSARALSFGNPNKKSPQIHRSLSSVEIRSNHDTLLHLATNSNPEAIKTLLARMKKEWPSVTVPILENSEGLTPLRLAFMKKDRRIVGGLLDHMKDYPIGFC